jgi:hypothetical protein
VSFRPSVLARTALGPAPRTPSPALQRALALPPRPGWCSATEPLSLLWTHHQDLLANGVVATGWVFMANTTMFERGNRSDAPGGVVYGFDPLLDHHPGILQAIGKQLFAFFHLASPPHDPAVRRVAELVRNVSERPFHLLLPGSLTNGAAVYLSTTVLFHHHLRDGFLGEQGFPFLVQPGTRRVPMLVPHTVWE